MHAFLPRINILDNEEDVKLWMEKMSNHGIYMYIIITR